MGKITSIGQKTAYGALFCLALPLGLGWWANRLSPLINMPVPEMPWMGMCLMLAGGVLMLWAMANLWQRGHGLPMNAFPPEVYVTTGAYRWFRHPIYVGAVAVCLGFFLWRQSAAGIWWVSPVFALLVVAYVLGFEHDRIHAHFGGRSHQPIFALPPDDDHVLKPSERWVILVMVFGIWLCLYEAFVFMGLPSDVVYSEIALDARMPKWDVSVLPYITLYPLAALLPFVVHSHAQARRFVLDSFAAMILIYYVYLAVPAAVNYAAQTPENNNLFGQLIAWGKTSQGVAALPSFHVFWALLTYRYYAERFPKWRLLCGGIAALIIISCLTTASHTILDVVFGILAYIVVVRRITVYRFLLASCEYIANSWREWRIGRIRVINHGFYAGIGAFFGFAVMAYFLPGQLGAIYALGVSGFIGAALWAQWLEGASGLSRPFGYYGSVIGMMIVAVLLGIFFALPIDHLLAASALAACPVQFFGRGRCLIQGCCHGRPMTHGMGLHFHHSQSRVHRLANWRGRTLYPTQFHSMLANAALFFLLWRLTRLGMPALFIAGTYLIANGASRFVEEAFRGEPQTAYWLGMRVYQWLAMLSVALGILLSTLPSSPLPHSQANTTLWLHAVVFAVLITIVYGVDFPESNKRFSRLSL